MTEALLQNETWVRLGCFFGILVAMMAWEAAAPRRRLSNPRTRRWPSNLGIVFLNSALVRLLIPLAPVAAALLAADRGWGLLNLVEAPEPLSILAAVVVLDLAIYWQHVVFHRVPVLWRLHRMHHADQDIDVTTGARFHPIEILLSILIKIAVIAAIGAPAAAVVLFEVILNGMAMFNHANIRLPPGLDAAIRLLFVTPDMHRVHHSVHAAETHSNFGFNLAVWDRLFGTYTAQPRDGHEGMTIGLPYLRAAGEQRLDRLLTQPFRRVD